MKIKNNTFTNKTILITGGTGSIGRNIVIQLLSNHKPKLVKIFARDEYKHFELEKYLESRYPKNKFEHIIGDIRDSQRLNEALKRVDIVIHTASLKHVTHCEGNPDEAVKTNIIGAQNLINLSIENGVSRVVAVSTDKAVYPTTVMGISKLMMERLFIQKRNSKLTQTKFAVVRFGNVLNSRGSVIPRWIEQIKNGENIQVTDKKMRRFIMSIPNAVKLIIFAVKIMRGREIIVFKMPEVSIFKLAQETIKKYGKNKNIKIKLIGMRDREKLRERLFTEEEKELMYENEKFYIILPDRKTFLERRGVYE